MSPRSFKGAAATKSKKLAVRLHKSGCPRARYRLHSSHSIRALKSPSFSSS